MHIFIFLTLLYTATMFSTVIDQDELEPIAGGAASTIEWPMLPEDLLATKEIDAAHFTSSQELPNPPRVHAYGHRKPSYSYETACGIGGALFFGFYGLHKLIIYGIERIHRSSQIPGPITKYPQATTWIHQEMQKHGLQPDDYLLKVLPTFHEWTIPVQTRQPYILTVSEIDLLEIESIMTNHISGHLLDRYRCAIHIACTQLSRSFISQSYTHTGDIIRSVSALYATGSVSLIFFLDRGIYFNADAFDDIVHTMLPCIALYNTYQSIKKLNATEATTIKKAIDTLPAELIPACIQFFEEKKRFYSNTTWYDEYIKRLTDRLPKQVTSIS